MQPWLCAGSTTAEGACESVRLACQQLVQNTLAPIVQQVAEAQKHDTAEALWKAVLEDATGFTKFPSPQLSAYAHFDNSRRDKPAGQQVTLSTTKPTRFVAVVIRSA